ncbi:putative monocarboxylate transporter mch1 [Agyrium rufum]|nr:putative monocarboxylate transporter mch1 [Agyrium rufum]
MAGSRSSSRSQNEGAIGGIDKLDFDANRKPRSASGDDTSGGMSSPGGLLRDDESLLSNILDGVIERDRRKMQRAVEKYASFGSAVLASLCAGSITAFSLYGHLFLSRLHYTQGQVNLVSISASLAMYLPVPIVGYICDRYSPRPLSFISVVLFGLGYTLAAFTYKQGPPVGKRKGEETHGWPPGVMIFAFMLVGTGTTCMYLSAVTTVAKNFARGKHKGLALAIPSASFGLSAVWESQVGSRLLYERLPDGSKGDVDAFKYFLFLAITLAIVGLIGGFGLKVIDEEELIEEGVEELQRSGLLDDSPFFDRTVLHDARGYGTIDGSRDSSSIDDERPLLEEEPDANRAAKKAREDEDAARKTWLLNGETRRFLSDKTMWLLAAGFFLVTGPGETFINNLGTIITTLYPPPSSVPDSNSAATNVSVLALTSTISRLLLGFLSDLFAPQPSDYNTTTGTSNIHDTSSTSSATLLPTSRLSSSRNNNENSQSRIPFTLSRITFLLASLSLQIVAFTLLASPLSSSQPSLLPLMTGLMGAGNGGMFSLVPTIISVVWGVQNFGTNWGIIAMVPALGAAIWSAIYSAVYMDGVKNGGNGSGGGDGGEEGGMCWGRGCWEGTVWGWVACACFAGVFWVWAWRGKGGWKERGVLI